MTPHIALARPADLLTDPMFRTGYDDFWTGRDPQSDMGWIPEEQTAYERGRGFALWLQNASEGRVMLNQGTYAHPLAVNLLIRAIRAEAVV